MLDLPFRNILRNRRRTVITLMAICVGALTVLLFGGYTNAIVHGVETGFVRQIGHLQIQRKGYFLIGTGSPADYGIRDYDIVMNAVRNDPSLTGLVRVVTPVLNLQGIAGNFSAGVSRTVAGVGMVPSDQNALRQWNAYNFPGEAKPVALPQGQDDVAVIGQGVARALQLCATLKVPDCPVVPRKVLGGTEKPAPEGLAALAEEEAGARQTRSFGDGAGMEVLAATVRGMPNVASVRVVAAENQGIKEMDDMFVALPLPLAQRLVYGGTDPQVTAIVVQLNSSDLTAATERLNALIKRQGWDLEVIDFQRLNPTYDQIRGLFMSIFGFIAILIGTIVLFSVANTMSMAVMERTAEIGTLRSLGIRRNGISRLFMVEGLMIGAIGAGLGSGIALGLAALINGGGLTWTPPGQTDPIPLVVHVFDDPMLIGGTFIGLTLLAALSGVLPARKAARLAVVDAIRHV